ncbi:MAG: acetyl-CoA carboxylase carboxyl transferase subunit alpha [Clostridia bacterium]|nr:acetyl-CoA carboxylase carboxyl transferase subunit alpha [Clostridia bacterium]
MNAYEKVMLARASDRQMGSFYIDRIIDNFTELHGDRSFGEDGAIVGGVGFLSGIPVTCITMKRGDSLDERIKRNFGCPSPEGYRKALRLMRQAEKFGRPIICFVGSPGAYCGITAEERGQGQAIAENLWEMCALKTPIISVVVGAGGSGGALALSVADKILMFENAVYSVISPEGCASILYKDAAKAPEAAEALRLTANDLYRMKVADAIIPETYKTPEEIARILKKTIISELSLLSKQSMPRLLASRYEKFRAIGTM